MCEALGSEPIEDQIPIEFDDLPNEVQYILYIYNLLQDNWDYMGGNYIGKSMTDFWNFMKLDKIPEQDVKYYYELVVHIDSVRAEQIKLQQKSKEKPAK